MAVRLNARRLDVECIVSTAGKLSERVGARFPGRGIHQLSRELVGLGRETERRLDESRKPNWIVRVSIATLIVVGLALLGISASRVKLGSDIEGIDEWLSVIQDAIQDVIFFGVAIVFLVTIEARLRRRGILVALHEMRSVVHVIDMHQLTKAPDSLLYPDRRTPSSEPLRLTPFELSRYLD